MESAAVFLVGIAIVLLVFWIIQNDGASSIRQQRGFFRMRPPAEPGADAATSRAGNLKLGPEPVTPVRKR